MGRGFRCIRVNRPRTMRKPVDFVPEGWRPAARRVRDAFYTDGTLLVVIGVGVFARGVSYLGYSGSNPHPAEALLDISTWAVIWMAVGAACVLSAPWHTSLVAAVALSLGVGLNMFWACSFMLATLTGDMSRGWVTAIGYFSIAVISVWAVSRGRRGQVRRVVDD